MAPPALVVGLVAAALSAALPACSSDDTASVEYPGQMLWTDVKGKTQPPRVIFSSAGPEHCEWQNVTFLYLGHTPAAGGKQYLRDPEGVIPARMLATSYAPQVELPCDARDTGFRHEDAALWVTSEAAYILTAKLVERWPQSLGYGVSCV